MKTERDQPVTRFTDEVDLAGHIIDSLLLPKVLDEIMSQGGRFEILNISVGQRRQDPSAARLLVSADSAEQLDKIVRDIGRHGAVRVDAQDVQFVPADMDGAFPEGFFCSTNQETQVRIEGVWHRVDRPEMDCGLVVYSPGPCGRDDGSLSETPHRSISSNHPGHKGQSYRPVRITNRHFAV